MNPMDNPIKANEIYPCNDIDHAYWILHRTF